MANPRPTASLYARIDSLTREIGRVRAKHHPYRAPEIVYDSLSALLSENRQLLDDAIEFFAPNSPGFLEAVKTAERMTALLVDLFTNSDRADSPRIPFEILNSLAVAAEVVTDQRCKVMVHLTPQYNYQIISLRDLFVRNEWLQHWKGDEHNTDGTVSPRTVLVMVFPSYEVGSILLHAAAAHELGHVLAQQRRQQFDAVVDDAISRVRTKYFDQIEGWVTRQLVRNQGESVEDAFARGVTLFDELLDELSRNWAEEIFADLLAARLVGPPFLLALERITLGVDPAHEDEDELSTHPSDSLRFALVSRYLNERLPHVCADPVWRDVLDRQFASSNTNLLVHLAKEVCFECFDWMSDFLESIRTPLANASGLRRRLLSLHRLIGELSPVSANTHPSTPEELADIFWLLFYAFWNFRLHPRLFRAFRKRYGWMAANDESKAESAMGSILLHSIQSLELRYMWSAVNGIGGTDAPKQG